MAFRKGLEEVQKSAERSRQFGGGSNRYFKWEPGEVKVIRFLTEGDEIVLTNLHEFITCHDGTKRSFVCRLEVGEDCELCKASARKREVAYAVAIWREESKKDGKTVFKTKMDTVTVEENGKTITKEVPWVGVLQQAPRNFWAWFYSAYDKSGTLLDRDFSVTRQGDGMETKYQPYPEDKQELKNMEKFDEFKSDLEAMLARQASKEYYDRFLHGIEGQETGSSESQLTEEDLQELQKANAELAASAKSGDFD